ncbi:MAG: trehalose-phosphatase [Thermoleophilia bacterium]
MSEAYQEDGPGANPVGALARRTASAGARAPGPDAGGSVVPKLPTGLAAALDSLAHMREAAALFFDIDGVLAPIRPRPEQAEVPEAVLRLLAELARSYRLVAAVSGRSLEEATVMVKVPGIVVVGDHGREVLDEGGHVSKTGDAERRLIHEAAEILAADAGLCRAGVRVEEKKASIALHTRGAADEERALTTALEAAAIAAARCGLVWRQGRSVVDLKIPGVDKGTAVESLVVRYGVRAALYVGDDTTDVDAMLALRRLRSRDFLAVLVGVLSDEMPAELAEASDYLLAQAGVPLLLRALVPVPVTPPADGAAASGR